MLSETEQKEYENALLDTFFFMFQNRLLNTYLIVRDGESTFSIILQTKDMKSKELLKHLGKYKKIKTNDEILSKGENCSICCAEYQFGEYKRELGDCKHVFHKKCIDKWLTLNQDNKSCPICRQNYNRKVELID